MSTVTETKILPPVDTHPPIAHEYLPSSGSSKLKLLRAEPIEYHQICLLNANEWKGPLSVNQYLEREQVLNGQNLTKDGKITAWILTDLSLPPNLDGSRPILASCETILKHAYVARGGRFKEILVHGIGSVFTRSEHRGKGYAARMMKELANELETWQQDAGQKGSFSVLYSDIGQKFYARFGWKPFPSTHIHLSAVTPEDYERLRTHIRPNLTKGLPRVEDLTRDDLTDLPIQAYVEDELSAFSAMEPNIPHVAIKPDMAHFQWHFAREEFQCKALGLDPPTIKGAIHRDSGIAILWCRVYASDRRRWSLHVLHVAIPPGLRAGPKADDHLALAALLLRAQKEAGDWDMLDGVEVWDPSGFVISAAQKLRLEEDVDVQVLRRDKEHICSLKWNGALPDDKHDKDVIWMHNEKYAWC